MDIEWYRDKVANVPKYQSPSWRNRVDRMPERQVIALYFRFKKDGLYDNRKKLPKKDTKGYQYTIFDFIGGNEDE